MIYIIGNDGTPQRVDGIGKELYPVGSIYMSTKNTKSPAEMFGGTWEQIKDKFLLSAGDTYSAGSTGGEATHLLKESEMPNHSHSAEFSFSHSGNWYVGMIAQGSSSTGMSVRQNAVFNSGGDQPHNNMPPYLAVYCWERIS